jgi:Transglutaminase-like superfamily/Domain of unknown function (DUF4129)
MSGLHEKYGRFLQVAARAGLTDPTGLTPREHERRLIESDALTESDVSRLRELIESTIYGGDEGGRAEAEALLAGLTRKVGKLPRKTRVGAAGREVRTSVVRSRALPIFRSLGGFAILGVFLLVASRGGCSAVGGSGGFGSGGSRGGRATGGWVAGITPVNSRSEYDAVRAATDRGWRKRDAHPDIEEVTVPEFLETGDLKGTFGFDLRTGTDHNFVNWKEPFSPPLSLRHRTVVFSGIDNQFRFVAPDEPLVPLPPAASSQTRTFSATVKLHLKKGEPVPVPTPTPDAVVTGYAVTPRKGGTPPRIQFQKDPADGLRAISDQSGLVEIKVDFVARDGYLSTPLPATPMKVSKLRPMPLPANVRADAKFVLGRIGGLPAANFDDTVRRLQAWCNGFVIAPIEKYDVNRNAFLTVALARKGCCRHRATTFTVLANAAGIPARMVTNEIHAFAEVQLPNGSWRAVDFRLGEGGQGPWEFVPLTLGDWEVEKIIAAFAACAMIFSLLLAVAYRLQRSKKPPVLDQEHRGGRVARRLARVGGEEDSLQALQWLVDHTLVSLSRRFGLPVGDDQALFDALQTEQADELIRGQALHLLEKANNMEFEGGATVARRQEIYWCTKNVLRWIDGRRTIDRCET